MKVTAINAFFEALKKPQQVIAIFSAEPADREQAVARALVGEATVFDAEKASPQAIVQELESLSLFGDAGTLVVKNLEKGKKPLLDALAAAVVSPQRSILLVGEKLNAATKLYKTLVEHALVLDLPKQKAWELERQLPQWVAEQMRREKRQMSTQVAHQLVQLVGCDKTQLQREIEKLICYLGERQEATLADVRAVCTLSSSVTIWDLSKVLFAGRVGEAVGIGRELLRSGTVLPVVLRQLRNQFQTDLQVWSIMSSGGQPTDVTKEFGYMRGRILEEHLSNARNFGGGRLKRALTLIDDTDLKSKSSPVDPALLLDRLLVRL